MFSLYTLERMTTPLTPEEIRKEARKAYMKAYRANPEKKATRVANDLKNRVKITVQHAKKYIEMKKTKPERYEEIKKRNKEYYNKNKKVIKERKEKRTDERRLNVQLIIEARKEKEWIEEKQMLIESEQKLKESGYIPFGESILKKFKPIEENIILTVAEPVAENIILTVEEKPSPRGHTPKTPLPLLREAEKLSLKNPDEIAPLYKGES